MVGVRVRVFLGAGGGQKSAGSLRGALYNSYIGIRRQGRHPYGRTFSMKEGFEDPALLARRTEVTHLI